MPSYKTEDIRNVLLVGQNASGKTTLADALLFASGAVTRKGSVTDGTSFSDFEKEEREHKHSISPSLLRLGHRGAHINLIDAPGTSDLLGPVISCLSAVETVVVVINAQNGIEPVTRRMMELARERDLPRAIVINKIDASHIDVRGLVSEIRERFGSECLPINLPADNGRRVVDCLLNGSGTSDLGSVADAHRAVLDQIVELDETLMERYLAGGEPDYSALHAPFERAMDEAHIVPICFTSAREGAGVDELLDVMARHFPSPIEGNPRPFVTGDDKPFRYESDAKKSLLAHVFRTTSDPYIGKLAFFRVYQGTAKAHSEVFIGHTKRPVRVGHVLTVQGKDNTEVDSLIAGDIGAVAKIEEIMTGDVLHEDHALDYVHQLPEKYPPPLYGLAIAVKSRNDEQKLAKQLHRFTEEDPTFKVEQDANTHEVVIHGLGELHLRLILERMKSRGLEVNVHPPKIAYRETITAPADGHHRHKKQTGGAGQFADVSIRIEPLERGQGFEFVDKIFGGAIPKPFVAAVEKGVQDEISRGVLAGYPVQDVRVMVLDGKTHPVDSKEIAFRTAGRFAFRDAFLKASPVLLEPIVTIEVTVPSAKVGTITGDISSRRGRVLGTDLRGGGQSVVRAQVPLAEVAQYQNHLKGLTGGQGSFVMDFSHHEPAPMNVQHELASAWKPAAEE